MTSAAKNKISKEQNVGFMPEEEDEEYAEQQFLEKRAEDLPPDTSTDVSNLTLAEMVQLLRPPFQSICDTNASTQASLDIGSADSDTDSAAGSGSNISLASGGLDSIHGAIGGIGSMGVRGLSMIGNTVGDVMNYVPLGNNNEFDEEKQEFDEEKGEENHDGSGRPSSSGMSVASSMYDGNLDFTFFVRTAINSVSFDKEFAFNIVKSLRLLGYSVLHTNAKRSQQLVQNMLVRHEAVPLVCVLICQSGFPALQDEAFKLGSFLLGGMNTSAQQTFLSVFQGESDLVDGREVLVSIKTIIDDFAAKFGGLRGPERLIRSAQIQNVMEFLQQLCEGQFRDMQLLLGDADGEENGINVMAAVANLLDSIRADVVNRMEWSADVTDKRFVMSLTNQIMETLADFIQGPCAPCQQVLVRAGVLNTIGAWTQIIRVETDKLTFDIVGAATAPSDLSFTDKMKVVMGSVQMNSDNPLENTPAWTGYLGIRTLETNTMVLLFSVLEGNLELEVIQGMLVALNPQVLTRQFERHWRSARFSDDVAHRVFRRGAELEGLLERACGNQMLPLNRITQRDIKALQGTAFHLTNWESALVRLTSCVTSVKDAATGLFTDSGHNDYLEGEDLELFKKEVQQKIAEHNEAIDSTRVDQLHSEDDQEFSVVIAFNYYVTIETMIETGNSLATQLSGECKSALQSWERTWVTSYGPIADQIPKFFGRIEVVVKTPTGDGTSLQRVYFPIPPSCRKQMRNPLVKKEQDDLLENVNRENPEEKLEDFVERLENIKDIISYQHQLLTKSKWKHIIGFLSRNEMIWVGLCYIVSLFINIILLSGVRSTNEGSGNNDYLDSGKKELVVFAGTVHVVLSAILLINYAIGSAQITVSRGRLWRSSGAEEVMQGNHIIASMFRIADNTVPDILWDVFYLLRDYWTFYYLIFLGTSILGAYYRAAFFCFHLLDIGARVKLLTYVLKSVTENIGQVLATLFLGMLLCYIYAVIAYSSWGFGIYSYGDACDNCGDWSTLYQSFMLHLDFGLRGAPIFDQDTAGDYTFSQYMFDISYNLLIILIMVAMITGIIIDTFADMRTANNEIEDDTNNKCFICSISREVFERKSVNFQHHIKNDHNMWSYMYYQIYLLEKNKQDLTGTERYLVTLMKEKKTSYFPLNSALALETGDEEEDDIQKLAMTMKTNLSDLEASIVERFESKYDQIAESLASLHAVFAEMKK